MKLKPWLIAFVATIAPMLSLGLFATPAAAQIAPETPSINNLPTAATFNGPGFTAALTTTSDGTPSVTSSTDTVCTVTGTLTVTYAGGGTCTLTAHTAASANYTAADGIGRASCRERVSKQV